MRCAARVPYLGHLGCCTAGCHLTGGSRRGFREGLTSRRRHAFQLTARAVGRGAPLTQHASSLGPWGCGIAGFFPRPALTCYSWWESRDGLTSRRLHAVVACGHAFRLTARAVGRGAPLTQRTPNPSRPTHHLSVIAHALCSGDTFQDVTALAWEVQTSPTAANVLFGYWSHDIGGFHTGDGCPGDSTPSNITGSEVFLRWVQFGAVSPIMRTHCEFASAGGGGVLGETCSHATPHERVCVCRRPL
jgi:hypothetical protein